MFAEVTGWTVLSMKRTRRCFRRGNGRIALILQDVNSNTGHSNRENKGQEIVFQVDAGPKAGSSIQLTTEGATIGRAERSPWNLGGDQYLSAHHARLSVTRERLVLVTDLGSTNGTSIDGLKIDGEVELQFGSILTVGSSELRLVGPSADSHTPTFGFKSSEPARANDSESTADEEAAGTSSSAFQPIGRSGIANIRGVSQNVQHRSETYPRRSIQVLNFRVDQYNSIGHLRESVPVELRGASIIGQLSDDDEVEVTGRWKNGVLLTKAVTNVTTDGQIVGRRMRRYTALFVILGLLVIVTPIAFIAGAAIRGFGGNKQAYQQVVQAKCAKIGALVNVGLGVSGGNTPVVTFSGNGVMEMQAGSVAGYLTSVLALEHDKFSNLFSQRVPGSLVGPYGRVHALVPQYLALGIREEDSLENVPADSFLTQQQIDQVLGTQFFQQDAAIGVPLNSAMTALAGQSCTIFPEIGNSAFGG